MIEKKILKQKWNKKNILNRTQTTTCRLFESSYQGHASQKKIEENIKKTIEDWSLPAFPGFSVSGAGSQRAPRISQGVFNSLDPSFLWFFNTLRPLGGHISRGRTEAPDFCVWGSRLPPWFGKEVGHIWQRMMVPTLFRCSLRNKKVGGRK